MNGQKFTQRLVNQQPCYEKRTVYDRRLKVHRPSIKPKKIKVKFL